MRNKIIIITTVCVLICFQAFAFDSPNQKIIVTPIGEILAKKLIRENVGKINLKNLKIADNIEPEQSFKIIIKPKYFYVISAHRKTPSDGDLFTCSVLLFDQFCVIKSSFDIMGNYEEKRPWYCDHVEAMSFKDYYPDGNLKIIGMYRGTPPSNEHFILPVILRLDFNKPSLEIDETLTGKLEDVDVDTIKAVRSYLEKHSDN